MSSPQPKKYAAFISYRHLMPDMAIARALARMLEHNMIRPNRQVKRNIGPIFVDVNELPLTESLDNSIVSALENSEILIVICSPNLPKSKYCMREISYFKEIHGGRTDRIYTLLVDGDPADSFPDILRTNEMHGLDENGQDSILFQPVEPLFADVRAPSVRESIKKLRKTEYLRLAAAYYRCSYDDLYQRRKRWLWKMGLSIGSAAAAAALGFGVYAYARNLQYSAVKAATYASYAREQSEEGDELLAITLCQEAWEEGVFSRSQRYMTALRSAAVQYDYKLRAAPLAQVMTSSYLSSNNINSYISSDKSTALVHSDHIFHISDTRTGQVTHVEAVDLVKVQKSDVSWYILISAEPDDQGLLQDTLRIFSLEDHHLIHAIPFRPTGLEAPDYTLEVLLGQSVEPILELYDGEEMILRIDKDGNPVSEEEKQQRALLASQKTTEAPLPFTIRTVGFPRRPVVQNAEGETVLTFDEMPMLHAFSQDQALFAFLTKDMLHVYDTSAWTLLASMPVSCQNVSHIYLLEDSTYVILDESSDNSTYNRLFDWRTGQLLASFPGRIDLGADHFFYTTDQGQLIGYHYNPMDTAATCRILAQHEDFFLTRAGNTIALVQEDAAHPHLQAESVKPMSNLFDPDECRVQASDDLSRILINQAEGLSCFDRDGQLLWQTPHSGSCFALSRDGALAAWLDEDGNACVADAGDGHLLYTVSKEQMSGISHANALAVSRDGLCICDQDHFTADRQFEERSLFFPAHGQTAMDLGHYSRAALYDHGLLFLTGSTYVMDFAVWDVHAGRFIYQPAENTGSWVYSPVSGYLIRHLETSGSNASLELEVLRYKKGQFIPCGRIALPSMYLDALYLDASGEILSFTAGSTTRIFRLKDLSPLLETTALPLYYENGSFYSPLMQGGQVYAIPFMEDEALRAFALDLITSPAGVRELTMAEHSRYSFDDSF